MEQVHLHVFQMSNIDVCFFSIQHEAELKEMKIKVSIGWYFS